VLLKEIVFVKLKRSATDSTHNQIHSPVAVEASDCDHPAVNVEAREVSFKVTLVMPHHDLPWIILPELVDSFIQPARLRDTAVPIEKL
jgi:hypothetical protein